MTKSRIAAAALAAAITFSAGTMVGSTPTIASSSDDYIACPGGFIEVDQLMKDGKVIGEQGWCQSGQLPKGFNSVKLRKALKKCMSYKTSPYTCRKAGKAALNAR